MTRGEVKPSIAAVKGLMVQVPEALREIVRSVMQAMLEAEMDVTLGAAKGERTEGRLGYRSGHYSRTLITRVGKLELRVPQDRAGRFSTWKTLTIKLDHSMRAGHQSEAFQIRSKDQKNSSANCRIVSIPSLGEWHFVGL